ncbi:NuA4 histone H4 acetyltransferase complex and the SWR1 complex subunit [Spiromyces aspiralis]|uniref:NuA4 histone H4 acetyltransferase complex and the SWR1 complex subunit n=1 Tax=Spiromyces aspiralis TaxID=68401 RepID=A0ACC1HX45_9FUNG|nr:NuA4 histone H4 acetyltransferase complex and the SWR1 complex subunit [Spiromyces aspiralis]
MKGNKRIKGIVVSKPIIYGNTATELTPTEAAANNDHTHRWTVFLRGVNNQDISYFIHKVEIKLHETFINSNRVLKSPPYEVTETGWGEFEVIIRIHFPPCSGEKPISIYHMLKLYPPESDHGGARPRSPNAWPKGKPLFNVFYEELVFIDPTEEFMEILTQQGQAQEALVPELPFKSLPNIPFSIEAEANEVKQLEKAITTLSKQVSDMKEQSQSVEKKHSVLKQEIALLEDNLHTK